LEVAVSNANLDLTGRTAVVTGAANGIGRAVAETLLSAGATVAAVDKDDNGLRALVERRGDAKLSVHEADLSRTPEVRRVIDAIGGLYGGIDVLVNNVGGSAGAHLRLEDTTEEDYDRVLDLNLRSAFFAIQAALPYLRQRGGGSVINLASIAGRSGFPHISPQYSAAKGGIVSLTQNLASRFGEEHIRVNAVAPGYIDSGARVQAIWDSRDTAPIVASIALRRRGETDEVASTILFLASDASAYITGATIDINGGVITR
jgi:3-oxoacyl-[acyl-carrier protein] reductase